MPGSAPNSHQIVKFLSAATTGAALLLLSGPSYTATVVFLVLATPVLVLCSPILVPAGIVVSLVVLGFIFSGGFGLGGFASAVVDVEVRVREATDSFRPAVYQRMRTGNKAGEAMDERVEEKEEDEQKKAEEVTQSA